MDRLVKHIEYLLLQHDCVIIPDFGGFVLQSMSAIYSDNEHSFTPTRKEIVFNPTLTHNDGLLVESYMQKYSVDFEKAQQIVRKDIAEMKGIISDYSELQLGKIGLFIKEDERLFFMPDKKNDVFFSTWSYGLPVFHYIPLSARSMVTYISVGAGPNSGDLVSPVKLEKNSRNVMYSIPVTRTFLHVVATAVAAILLFLFISTPVSDVNKASYSASFVPQEIMPKVLTDEIVSGAFSKSPDMAYNNATVSSEKKEYTSESNSITAKPASSTAKPASSKTSSAISSPSKTGEATMYYVVICSFINKVQTQAYIKGLKGSKEAATADILVRDGRARGYAKSFTNKKDAQSYLDELHKNPKHKDAWIYHGN